VLSGRVIEFGAGLSFCPPVQVNTSEELPDVPVMPETLLLLELCAHGSSADLSELAQVVLGDPGATIQVIRAVGQEGVFGDERPRRIEDCISALSVQSCIEAASRKKVSRSMNKPGIARVWAHSIEIAKRCRLMADGTMRPDEAYLAGLLHELGSLPTLLEWNVGSKIPSEPMAAGLRLALEWNLPQCVAEYFSAVSLLNGNCRWSRMVQRAHEMSSLPAVPRASVDKTDLWVVAGGRK
jgi:hypothetical protein